MINLTAVRVPVDAGIANGALSTPPRCAGCGKGENVAPSVASERAPYFCIRCCNYLDSNGAICA